jgi:hypothetical protein
MNRIRSTDLQRQQQKQQQDSEIPTMTMILRDVYGVGSVPGI